MIVSDIKVRVSTSRKKLFHLPQSNPFKIMENAF